MPVEHFDGFFIRDGVFIGKVGNQEYKIKELVRKGNGDVFVTYYEDGKEEIILQHQGSHYVNTMVY